MSVSVRGQRSTEERWSQVDRDAREPARARGEIQIIVEGGDNWAEII